MTKTKNLKKIKHKTRRGGAIPPGSSLNGKPSPRKKPVSAFETRKLL